jgi:hypothetical protein
MIPKKNLVGRLKLQGETLSSVYSAYLQRVDRTETSIAADNRFYLSVLGVVPIGFWAAIEFAFGQGHSAEAKKELYDSGLVLMFGIESAVALFWFLRSMVLSLRYSAQLNVLVSVLEDKMSCSPVKAESNALKHKNLPNLISPYIDAIFPFTVFTVITGVFLILLSSYSGWV